MQHIILGRSVLFLYSLGVLFLVIYADLMVCVVVVPNRYFDQHDLADEPS